MAEAQPHISVCICTYRRAEFLGRLLAELGRQETEGLFGYSIVVVDNDAQESARPVVDRFSEGSGIPVEYCVEPEQGIALARNRAVRHAAGDFIAFIDDDEFPAETWLRTLFRTCSTYGVDGVLGPVKPYFEHEPPRWVIKGRFYDRPSYETGFVIDWRKGRTGNVLLRKQVFEDLEGPFRPEFLTGEDQDLFRRLIERGFVFIWCDEAVAWEYVPAIRWNRGFMLKRALLRGQMALNHPVSRARELIKSLFAVAAYALLLPFLFLFGHHLVMKYLVKMFDHLGKILGFLRIHLVREKYVTG